MSRIFAARYEFTCACCNQQQPEGVAAAYGPDGLLRNVEPDHTIGDYGYDSYVQPASDQTRQIPVMPHGKKASDRCDRCFIIHANGQEECY